MGIKMKKLKQFILGVQFLTRIPIRANMPAEPSDFKGALCFFTVVGLIIGTLEWLLFSLGMQIDPLLGALLATIGGIWITGGMHLDGLADVFDGFGANRDTERTLEIMKDSRIGSFGVLALMIDFAFHMVGFYLLKDTPLLIIWVPISAKFTVCVLCDIGKNIKKGLGALWIENISKAGLFVNLVLFLFIGCILLPWELAVIGLGLVYGVAVLLNKKFTHKLTGLNGDCLGAASQMTEWIVMVYLLIVSQML